VNEDFRRSRKMKCPWPFVSTVGAGPGVPNELAIGAVAGEPPSVTTAPAIGRFVSASTTCPRMTPVPITGAFVGAEIGSAAWRTTVVVVWPNTAGVEHMTAAPTSTGRTGRARKRLMTLTPGPRWPDVLSGGSRIL
jgi:hypothetical protein